MTATISGTFSVESADKSVKWVENFTGTDFEQITVYLVGREPWSFLAASFVPLRTDTWGHLVSDTLLPTTVNHAIGVHNVALKILAIGCAVVWDLGTLPFRLFNRISRMFSNDRQPEHPLRKHLRESNVDPKLIDTDYVFATAEIYSKTVKNNREYTDHFTKLRKINFVDLLRSNKDVIEDKHESSVCVVRQ